MQNIVAIRLLFTANIVSGIAQGITMLAIPWYFIDILDMSSFYGLLYATITICSLFWSLYSGTLIDRYPRKNLFMSITMAGFVFLIFAGWYGNYTGYTSNWIVAGVFAFTMFNYQVHYPSLYAFGQEITKQENYAKFNSYLEIQGQVSNVLAGGLGAILLSGINKDSFSFMGKFGGVIEFNPWTMEEVFLMDGCTYLIAFLLISAIRYTPIANRNIDTSSIKNRIKQGVNFLKENKLIFYFGNASYSVFVFLLLCVHLLFPMYVDNHLNEQAGLFSTAYMLYALGALSAGIWTRKVIKDGSYLQGIIALMLFCGVSSIIIATTKSLWLFLVYALVMGLTNAGVRILRVTFLFQHVSNDLIGRVSSVFHMINILLRFLFISLFSIAYFNKGNNVVYAYFIFALFVLVSALPIWLYRKKLDNLQVDPTEG